MHKFVQISKSVSKINSFSANIFSDFKLDKASTVLMPFFNTSQYNRHCRYVYA